MSHGGTDLRQICLTPAEVGVREVLISRVDTVDLSGSPAHLVSRCCIHNPPPEPGTEFALQSEQLLGVARLLNADNIIGC